MDGDALRLSGQSYLSSLHGALIFLVFGLLVDIGFAVLSQVTTLRFGRAKELAMLPMLAGLWWLATPDARNAQSSAALTLRKLIRVYAGITALDGLIGVLEFDPANLIGGTAALWLYVALAIAAYVGRLVVICYLQTLARRISSPKLVRFAAQLEFLAGVVLCAAIFYEMLVTSHGSLRPSWWLVPYRTLLTLYWSRILLDALTLLLVNSIARRVDEQRQDLEATETNDVSEPTP